MSDTSPQNEQSVAGLFATLSTPEGQVLAACVAAVMMLLVALITAYYNRKNLHITNEYNRQLAQLQRRLDTNQLQIEAHHQWQTERRERMLERISTAMSHLEQTAKGFTGLVERGPVYSNIEMYTETAQALAPYSKFKESMGHYSITGQFAQLRDTLNSHISHLLLTLSPLQEVRQSQARKDLLEPLKKQLAVLSEQFAGLCREFEKNPDKFGYGYENPPDSPPEQR